MKLVKKKYKKKLFKKLFILLARFMGYEIIDQSNLEVPTQKKTIDENLHKPHLSSIVIPLGKVNITRKILDLTILVRTATNLKKNEDLVDQRKKRVFEFPKSEYTLRTINSVIHSCNDALQEFNDFNINLIVTDDNSETIILKKIQEILKKANFKTSIINLDKTKFISNINKNDAQNNPVSDNMISNMINFYQSLILAKNQANDLVYFLEDDYIHERHAIKEMLFSYERISSQLNKELFLCPADYPFLYDKIEDSKIFIGSQKHWRTVNASLVTFMTSKKMVLKYWEHLRSMATLRHQPFEEPLHKIYQNEYCLSPIPSLAMHCANINSIFGIPPNFKWKKVWEENEN